MPADVYRGDRQNMVKTPQVRLTPFAQLSLDHLKDARSRQFVPEGVAKSQRSFAEASPDSEGDGMCELPTQTEGFRINFNCL